MKTKKVVKQSVNEKTATEREYRIIDSPIGELMIVATNDALSGVYFIGQKHFPAASKTWVLNEKNQTLKAVAKQLEEYFAGRRTSFSVSIQFHGTEFQKKVWQQIAQVPHGKTITYSELAKRAGKPNAVRAAGTSTGRNPVAIIVPCHRIMGKDGSLHGFAGGLDKKRHLLGLEKIDFK